MKAFVFSLDAVVSLLLVSSFLIFAVTFMQSFPFSQVSGLETSIQASKALQVMRVKGVIDEAVNYAVSGNMQQAQTVLKESLSMLFKEKHKKSITLMVYDSSMNVVAAVQARKPERERPLKSSTVFSSVQTTVVGDYYVISYLQIWD